MTEDYDQTVYSYIRTKQFLKLAVNSKRIYMNGMDTLDGFLSGKKLQEITRPVVIGIRDDLFDRPGKCRVALSTLNNILKHAYDKGWVTVNHAARIGDLPPQKEIDRWYDNELDLFLTTAPKHVKNAMMLALYTGQRRSDLVRIKWSDYDAVTIYVKQRKTGKELWIPTHTRLKRHLESMRPNRLLSNGDYILTNRYGQPWPADSLRAAVKRHCAKIGLKGKMLHGVRKTTASILAEMGCDALQIMAITGHQSLKEVQRYVDGAEQKKMAKEAMDKWQ